MIIARATDKDSELLILGLSRENVTRLLDGQPIRIRRKTHGDGVPEGWEIIILWGETESTMHAAFVKHGLIGPETKIHRDPRL
jgi:hypothetical protein